jgi:hypothetical protein
MYPDAVQDSFPHDDRVGATPESRAIERPCPRDRLPDVGVKSSMSMVFRQDEVLCASA